MTSPAAAVPASIASNHWSDIEGKLHSALRWKRVCEVAFGALAVSGAAMLLSGVWTLPLANFLLFTGVSCAVGLFADLYGKAIATIQECEPILEFENHVKSYPDRAQFHVDRALSRYVAARREIAVQAKLFPDATQISPEAARRYSSVIAEQRDQIECWVLPDLFQAFRIHLGFQKMEDFGSPLWLPRAVRLETDAIRAASGQPPTLYFSSKDGRYKVSFVALNHLLEEWYQQHGKDIYPGVTAPAAMDGKVIFAALQQLVMPPSPSGSSSSYA